MRRLLILATICAGQMAFAKSRVRQYGTCYSQPQCQGETSDKLTTIEGCEEMLALENVKMGSWSAKRTECSLPTLKFRLPPYVGTSNSYSCDLTYYPKGAWTNYGSPIYQQYYPPGRWCKQGVN